MHVALRAPQPKEAYILQKHPSKKPSFSVPESSFTMDLREWDGGTYVSLLLRSAEIMCSHGRYFGRPLKTTFDMTTLIFSSGGCPSYPFYPLKRVPSYPFLAENPSSEGATKDHLSSKPPQGEPPGTKNQSGR